MKTTNRTAVVIGVFIVLAGSAMLIYILKLAWNNIGKVNPNIIAALITGSITFTGYFVLRHLEKKKAIELQIREQKLPVYEEFISFFFSVLFDEEFKSLSEKEKDAKILQFMVDFSKKAIIWFSDSSLKTFIEWKRISAQMASQAYVDHVYQLVYFEKMLLAFRKDIGHSNSNLNKGDLLSIFITDIENYLERINNIYAK